jgi:sigma-B regulation protein RsbU (phosphoserine phosphatase)
MMRDDRSSSRDPRLVDTFINDIHQPDFQKRMRREYRELKEFMLDKEQVRRLQEMGRVRGLIVQSWWLMKGLLLKLSSMRRLLLAIGLILVLASRSSIDSMNNTHILGGLILLFVLMLELKDKMLAREELEAGRSVQEALMPDRSPEVPGWRLWLYTRPANDVGGDLVDFLKVDEGRFNVTIGDVAGKGLSAALLTAKLQSSIRALLPGDSGLDQLAARLNRIFCRDTVPGMFASVICFELRSGSDRVKGVNAGHPPPVVFSAAGIRQEEKGGAALGLMPDASYREFNLELQPGETLIAYSDGLPEARNEQGEFFGEQRLLEQLTRIAAQPIDRIGGLLVAGIESFKGDARIHDDVTIILLRRS